MDLKPSTKTAPKPFQSPSYPQRTHTNERAKWEALLKTWQDRIVAAKRKLDVIPAGPSRQPYERIFAQMQGGRDQIADAVRRLPQEVGHMYHEDQHRLEEAVAALERLFARWDAGQP